MTCRPDLIDRWLTEFFAVATLVGGILIAILLVVGMA